MEDKSRVTVSSATVNILLKGDADMDYYNYCTVSVATRNHYHSKDSGIEEEDSCCKSVQHERKLASSLMNFDTMVSDMDEEYLSFLLFLQKP